MAADYFCATCEKFFDLDDLTVVNDCSRNRALYRDNNGLVHTLFSKSWSKRKLPPEPAPVVAPSAPQEVFVDVLAEVMAETETKPELPVDPLEEPESEPEVEDFTPPWKQQLRRFREDG